MTLIEFVTSAALVAVLGTLAVPGFQSLRQDAERTSVVNELFHAVFFARSEAIKRSSVVTVCTSADRTTCAGRRAAWSDGWIVFVNTDRDEPAARDAGEELLGAHSAWPRGRITSNRSAYSFRPYTQGVVNGTIVFCDTRGSTHARAIIISHTGRPRVSQRDASDKPLKCPPN